jgi:hypothetical protein
MITRDVHKAGHEVWVMEMVIRASVQLGRIPGGVGWMEWRNRWCSQPAAVFVVTVPYFQYIVLF